MVFDCFGRGLSRLQLLFPSDAGKSYWVNKRHNCCFVKDHGNLLLCKELPCFKNLQIVYFVTYRNIPDHGAPFVKILYLPDLAQKVLSLPEIAISACRDVISARDSYLCMQRCYLCQR